MREVLFRGKDSDGVWHEGYYCVLCGKSHRVYTGFAEIDCGTYYPDFYTVKPETVGQYTGLTDKNGKKIFDGDIVDCWSEGVNAKGTVQQRRDGLWFIHPAWQKHIMWGLCPDEYSNTTVEVIGNIHDNPELLEGEKSDA